MKKVLIIILLILLLIINLVVVNAQVQGTVDLSDKEKEYIKSKESIKVVVDPDWYPYEKINKNGEYIGIASDLIALYHKEQD